LNPCHGHSLNVLSVASAGNTATVEITGTSQTVTRPITLATGGKGVIQIDSAANIQPTAPMEPAPA